MKYCAFLSFIFLSLTIKAQKKLDNTIVVDTVRTIKEIKQILFNNGYTIDGTDTSFFVTTPKQMKSAAVLRLMFARTDTSVIIKGQYKLQVELNLFNTPIKNDFELVEYRLSKQNLNYEYFGEMNKVAKLLGSKITYLRQLVLIVILLNFSILQKRKKCPLPSFFANYLVGVILLLL